MVWCQQVIDGEAIDPEQVVDPQAEGMTDEETLRAKAISADARDWDIEWLSPTSFVARKVRWQDPRLCERIFWVA